MPSIPTVLSISVLFAALTACDAAPAPRPAAVVTPAEAAPPPDRTIWDGMPAATVDVARRGPQPVSRSTGRAPAEARPAPRIATVSGLRFEGEPLLDALKRVQAVTGAPILVTPQGREVIVEQDVRIDLELRAPLRLDQLLNLFAQQSPDLGWKVDDGVVWFTSKSDARGPLALRTYDVRDLLMPRPNFPAPQIRGLPTGESEYEREEEEAVRMMEPEQLLDLIRNATDPKYWDETEGASLEITENGILLVRADAGMLGDLRGAVGRLR